MAFPQFDTDMKAPLSKSALLPHTAAKANRKRGLTAVPSYDMLRGLHILQVDDVNINSLLIKGVLEEKGCIVDVASDGSEALRLFLASPVPYYSAILMDIVMPVMNGFEASKRIRALEREDAKRIPIIALTADYIHYIRNELSACGIDAGLLKPIRPDIIYATLQRLLEQKAAQV